MGGFRASADAVLTVLWTCPLGWLAGLDGLRGRPARCQERGPASASWEVHAPSHLSSPTRTRSGHVCHVFDDSVMEYWILGGLTAILFSLETSELWFPQEGRGEILPTADSGRSANWVLHSPCPPQQGDSACGTPPFSCGVLGAGPDRAS